MGDTAVFLTPNVSNSHNFFISSYKHEINEKFPLKINNLKKEKHGYLINTCSNILREPLYNLSTEGHLKLRLQSINFSNKPALLAQELITFLLLVNLNIN